jgi:hypothetical protein
MATNDLLNRLKTAKNDFESVTIGSSFNRIKSSPELFELFIDAKELASKWYTRVESEAINIDNDALEPLVQYMERVVAIADGKQLQMNESIKEALIKRKQEFLIARPLLISCYLDAKGVLELSKEDFPRKRETALADIASAVDEARTEIRKTADEAAADLELAKKRATKITVDTAQTQFLKAGKVFRLKIFVWFIVSLMLFISFFKILNNFINTPPELIRSIVQAIEPGSKLNLPPVSIPLLVAASAYFTSLRLAVIGILGVALAFSLRMTRAYFHMLEHNQHKLRVTNSIEAFVAAVRGDERKDAVLAKLVECATEFGESGILSKQGEVNPLPSVILDSVTKNVSHRE